MIIDALVAFLPPGSTQTLVGAAGTAIQIGNVIDLLGLGLGVSPQAAGQIIGNTNIVNGVNVFGTDFGIGAEKAQVQVTIGTHPTTGTSATLNVAFQAAPDNGSAEPGTWQTLEETGALTVAQLPANQIIARFDYPPAFPANLSPRFVRLLAQVPAATDFTAGTISQAFVTLARDDAAQKYAASNYVSA